MNRLHVETTFQRLNFEPGEEIEIFAEWELDKEPQSIEFRLVWNTAGRGTTDIEIAQTVPFATPLANDSRRFPITLPGSPYSFSGKLISLIWAMELVAFPSDASTRTEITIAPGGSEVLLTSQGNA